MVWYSFSEKDAQNGFEAVIEQAMEVPVMITRENRPLVYVLSPQALEDLIDGYLAKEAEREGFLSVEETEKALSAFRSIKAKGDDQTNVGKLPPCQ
ncbi:MAG: hypothetical protein WAQ53_18590 [Thiofilum sp.]|uniref:hypothetical protein n=1 Tax=Thiofilum sp. TaxID=2212733 RepID=UPI0025DC4E11|nr:hypothetical protein [Thiofilum sp.]MBK8455564.1 hypothetical protein [Thiofilum sp.]MBK8455577.1 hypothetical protein [Thiofilum sp.]